jgi:predicted secreted protein
MAQSVNVEEINLSGRYGEAISLPIAGGPATGYSWRLELPPGLQRIPDGPPRSVNPTSAIGTALGGSLRVEAAEAGDYVIVARLARPWEPDRPARLIRINLHVAP